MRSFFVDLHEAAVARDIACDNHGKAARPGLSRRLTWGLTVNLAGFEIANFSHHRDRPPSTANWVVRYATRIDEN
jgi:hypothetical protein